MPPPPLPHLPLRRMATALLLLIMFGLVICFLFEFGPLMPASARANAQDSLSGSPKWHNTIHQSTKAISVGQPVLADHDPQLHQHDEVDNHNEDFNGHGQVISDTVPKDGPGDATDIAALSEEDRAFTAAILQMMRILPDEIDVANLLRPLTESGEDLVREVALRSRAFGRLFAAWEDLHFTKSESQQPGEREVIQRLRQSGNSLLDVISAIHIYDDFRAFINAFAEMLFPWTMVYHADHMALHRSFYGGGRGVMLTAGNKHAPDLLRLIPSLRRLGCKLPNEVLYHGDNDLDKHWRDSTEAMPDVVVGDLSIMLDDSG